MKHGLKRTLALTVLTVIAAGYGLLAYHSAAMAEDDPLPTATPEPPATIVIQAEPAPTPGRVPRPQAVVYDYSIGRSYIETVARGMGDKVRCVSKRFGVQFTAIINGIKRTIQAQSETVSIVLGEPEITVLGEMKLSWRK